MLITTLNIYNPLNNIKFAKKKKKKKKKNLILDFLKLKYHTKRKKKKKIKINQSTIHTLNTSYYLKYL